MNVLEKIKEVFRNPVILITHLNSKGKLRFINDETYLKLFYKLEMNQKLNIDNPETFNEKLQYLKLHDRNPLYTKLVDKYAVREYVANTIGEEYLVPLFGVWDQFKDIDFTQLPNQFVLKTTHDSGGVIICRDKNKLDIEEADKVLTKSLKRNYYYGGREWPYKNVEPKIICEEYLEDFDPIGLKDYKFLTFHGEPRYMIVAAGDNDNRTKDFYDLDFNPLNIKQKYNNSQFKISKPQNFEKMIQLSKVLSEGIPHVRVDFNEIEGKIYFGELTFYHFSGVQKFEPREFDIQLGKLIDLSKISDE